MHYDGYAFSSQFMVQISFNSIKSVTKLTVKKANERTYFSDLFLWSDISWKLCFEFDTPYYSWTLIKAQVKPTITGRDGSVFRAQRVKASTEDIRQLCKLYQCDKCENVQGNSAVSCDTNPYTTFERRVCDGFKDCIDGRDEKK